MTDASWTLEDYDLDACQNPTQVPEDWTLPQDTEIDKFTRVEVCGDLILYGPYQEMAMTEGFTVVRYADQLLTPVYRFDAGITNSWQNFFSPDGKHIAFPWKISDGKPGGWQIRVVDLEGDLEEDVALPQWENEISILFVKWYDDTNLQVTAWGLKTETSALRKPPTGSTPSPQNRPNNRTIACKTLARTGTCAGLGLLLFFSGDRQGGQKGRIGLVVSFWERRDGPWRKRNGGS